MKIINATSSFKTKFIGNNSYAELTAIPFDVYFSHVLNSAFLSFDIMDTFVLRRIVMAVHACPLLSRGYTAYIN